MSFLAELKRRNVVRVAVAYAVLAWLLVQVSATILPMFGAPSWVARAVVVLLAVLAVPLLLMAWAFELTREGVKTQAEADAAGLSSRLAGPRVTVVVGVLLALAVGLFVLGRYTAPQANAPAPPVAEVVAEKPVAPVADAGASIAVLPFVNMSADKDNEYFSDGLSETLLDMLVQVPGLKVPARTSSFAFKGKSEDVRGIATALGVAHLLEGSVQKAGDTVRITAQLIRASDGVHVWSRRYDRKLVDVFAIQDEIATEVVGALKVALLPETGERLTQKRTENVDAYQEYLKGIALLPRRHVAELRTAVGHFERAITLDPAFAKAYVGAADAYSLLETYGTVTAEERARGLRYIDRALELAPDLGEAHASRGWAIVLLNKHDEAEREYRRAIELAPSYATAHHWYSQLLLNRLGRYAEGLAEMERAVELDPLAPVLRSSLADAQAAAGKVEAGRATIARLVAEHPDYQGGHATQAAILASQGDLVGALRAYRDHDRIDPDAVSFALNRCRALLDFHAMDEATACTIAIERRSPGNPAVVAMQSELELRSGRAEEALKLSLRAGDWAYVGTILAHWALDKPQEGLALMRQLFPFLFEEDSEIGEQKQPIALVAAALLLQAGETAQGRSLALRALAPAPPGAPTSLEDPWPWTEVFGRELLGERDQALDALERAVDAGAFVDINDLEWPPALAALRADPRFERILAPARAKAAEQVRLAKDAGLL